MTVLSKRKYLEKTNDTATSTKKIYNNELLRTINSHPDLETTTNNSSINEACCSRELNPSKKYTHINNRLFNSNIQSKKESTNDIQTMNDSNNPSSLKDDKDISLLIEKYGFKIKKMISDGACLFRAIAHQIYDNPEYHKNVRNYCIQFMTLNKNYFSQFVPEDYTNYLIRKQKEDCFANHVEIQAISELYCRKIEIYMDNPNFNNPLKIDPCEIDDRFISPLRISYHNGNHYNSLIQIAFDDRKFIDILSRPLGIDFKLTSDLIEYKKQINNIEKEMMEDKLRSTDNEYLEEALINHVKIDSIHSINGLNLSKSSTKFVNTSIDDIVALQLAEYDDDDSSENDIETKIINAVTRKSKLEK